MHRHQSFRRVLATLAVAGLALGVGTGTASGQDSSGGATSPAPRQSAEPPAPEPPAPSPVVDVDFDAGPDVPPVSEPAIPTFGRRLVHDNPLYVSRRALTASPVCDDGSSGHRIQVLYVRGESEVSSFAAKADLMREAMVFSDSLINESVPGAEFHLRMVHAGPSGGCVIDIQEQVVPDANSTTLGGIIDHIEALPQYQDPTRKYLFFAEVNDNAECGLASSWNDDSPGGGNLNNGIRPTHGGVGKTCWDLPYDKTDPNAISAVHEVFHMFGAVSAASPNASAAGHCTDESDLMCYVDGPGIVMTYDNGCGGTPANPNFNTLNENFLLDCNNDDYFDPSRPTVGFLAENFNTANSDFLYGNEGDRFIPLTTPQRAFDSREIGTGAADEQCLGLGIVTAAGCRINLAITPSNPFDPVNNPDATIPWNATGVVLNVTAINPDSQLNVTVWPARLDKPTASSLNITPGKVIANQVTVKLGHGGTPEGSGSIELASNRGRVDVAVDVVGYFVKNPAGAGSALTPVQPYRVLSSRDAIGGYSTPWGPATTRTVQIAGTGGAGGVPVTASAVVMNVTATESTAPKDFLSVFPSGQSRPNVSSLNFEAGVNTPNLVTVGLVNGQVDIYNHTGSVHVIADVVGYFDGPGSTFVPLTNTRVLDTRPGPEHVSPLVTFGPDQTQVLTLAGVASIPSTASGVVLNVTGVNQTLNTNIRLYPADAAQVPDTSNLNLVGAGPPRPNAVVVGMSADGKVAIKNFRGNVDVVADVVGYFVPA